jgi:cytoplasmic iron level regulating protein YaaA (DUF328/UPF0246 family)
MTEKKERKEKSIQDLKAKATELLKQAEEMEQKQFIRMGKITKKLYEEGYKDIEAFKKEIAKILQ